MSIRGAKAIIRDSSGSILILRRSTTHPYVPLTPDLPGGQVEQDETMTDGLIRELREEIGIEFVSSTFSLLGSNNVKNFYGKDYELELYEIVVQDRPTVTTSFEHDSYAWVPVKNAQIVAQLYQGLFEDYKAANA